MPSEEHIVPPGRHHATQHVGRNLTHRDDAHGKRSYCQDAELHYFSDDNTDHSAFDHIDRSDGNQDQGINVGRQMPWQESCRKLADTLEAITEKTNDTDKRVDHDDEVG